MKMIRTAVKRSLYAMTVVSLWHVCVKFFAVPEYVLPPPQAVLATLVQDQTILGMHFIETLKEWSIGLTASIAAGLVMSIAAFGSSRIEKYIGRFLIISQAVPYLTIAPLLLLWLGLGAAPKIVLILLTCTFPIAQLTLSGLQTAREQFSVLATILRFTPTRALLKLYAPAALPDFLQGVRISVTYAFVSTVLAELIGSEAGLGVYLSRAQSAYRTDRVLTVVFVIVSFSLFCTWIVSFLSKKLLFWKTTRHV